MDGTQSFLSAELPKTACMIDPNMCISGFAVGLKLRFSDLSLTSNAPQYVIDTGASASNKGVSVFLQLNSLYFKIVTSNAVYQVRVYEPNNLFQRSQCYQALAQFCSLQLYVYSTFHHFRPPFLFTQTNGSTSWETSAGRLDSRSIPMVSWWTLMHWERAEITSLLEIPRTSLWAAVSIKVHTLGFNWLPSPLSKEYCLQRRYLTSTVTSGGKVG